VLIFDKERVERERQESQTRGKKKLDRVS